MDRMTHLLHHPLFLIGLGIRLFFLFVVLPSATAHWFAPFLEHSVNVFSLDPWSSYLASDGDPRAFPYGYAMWLIFLPLTVLCSMFTLPISWGYGLTLLIGDIALLCVLRRLSDAEDRMLLGIYWLSPIVIFATYWLGLNDVFPILLLILGLIALYESSPRWSAAWMACAVSAKLSMILAIPFVFIYLFNNKRLQAHFRSFFTVFMATLLLLLIPYFLSSGGREMLIGNPELAKIYQIALPLGNGLQVYILPMVYLLVVFGAWRIGRMNFELLLAMLGLAFFLVLLLTPASHGWFIWVLPFLVLYQIKNGRMARVLVGIFSFLYLGLSGVLAPLPFVSLADWPVGVQGIELFNISSPILSIWQTVLVSTGVILVVRMLLEGIHANEFFRLSRKPFVLGISGDSGAGKDALAEAVAGLFGNHSVVRVSGDDYHLWDRQKPIWKVMTHLNPRANDLTRFSHDIQALTNGQTLLSRHYDHESGKMSKPQLLKSNDFIIVTGLHVFSLPLLRALCDLRVYLNMDETLRRHLKLHRDVGDRSHNHQDVLAAIDRREPDAKRYIRPQADQADLVLSLQPIHPETLNDSDVPLRLKLGVLARQGLYYEHLVRVLIGVCGLHVDIENEGADGAVELTIEGETDPQDIALAARELLPSLNELLDTLPSWQGTMTGVMQLIILSHITQSLRARLL